MDPAMRAMPASQLDQVVGRVASLDVAAGGLLSEDTVQPVVTPGKGVSVVGVSLSSGLLPAIGLQAGDHVRIVRTPGAQGEPSDKPAWSMDAQVVSVTPAGEGQASVVDVLVPSGSAADLASLAATGKVALVLDSRER